MNILLLTYQGDLAGSTNSISYLAKGLAERGHTVVMGCRKEALLYQLLEHSQVIRYPMTFKSKISKRSMLQIKAAVEQYNIQIINAQSSKDRYLSIFAKWRYRLPVKVVHTRRQRPNSIGGFFKNWIYNSADQIIAVSEGVKGALVQLGLKAEIISVIFNGLDRHKFQFLDPTRQAELQTKYGIKADDIVIGCISRLKQQAQILQALQYVEQPCTVLLVGVEAGQLEIDLDFSVPHRIFCVGKVSIAEAMNHYPLFTMKVLASVTEGLSQSLLEAMAMGIPVLATNASGNPDLVQDGENGLLFENEDVKGLAAQITRLIKDDSLRERLCQNGKATVENHFSIERTIQQHEQLFEQLIRG